ncbi:lycopene cyclase family protein [Gordonia zhaorongruii]|uniref:lycopene cyclase family protein n=1 Tax=Gordonia zhaorongruii TaxID=2597659 RepID=UPI001046B42E|nr:lycopene cyclase family protein [Gordonia zhaorongruii]
MTGHEFDVVVVGAGPAGRALAHRAAVAGLDVALIDPAPERTWPATYGMYTDDVPGWLDTSVIAAWAPQFTVYTPARRDIDRGYAILDSAKLAAALAVDPATVIVQRATHLTANSVTCGDGRTVRAAHVVDARGGSGASDLPRQTAAGVFGHTPHDGPAVVLMDWRPAPGAPPDATPSFSYRVQVDAGRFLVEETCLAGAPPLPLEALETRNRTRTQFPTTPSPGGEHVDFALLRDRTPWQRHDEAPLGFGASGGLMNPATGYSVAQSLHAADTVVRAIIDGANPHAALWTRSARADYRLRVFGLEVLLSLDQDDLIAFFDGFFRIGPDLQRRYLSHRSDTAGTLRAMAAVFLRVPMRLRLRMARCAITRPGCSLGSPSRHRVP